MVAGTRTLQKMWTMKNRALLLALLLTSLIAVLMTAQAPARASAFPGANGKILFASTLGTGTGVNNPEHDQEIFSMNPDGTGLKQLTKNTTNDFSPSYSADGKKIVYVNQISGTVDRDVFVMSADGKGKKDVSNNPAKDIRPSFSPDGKKIIFDSDRGSNSNFDVFIMNVDGTQQTALTSDPADDENATFSPGGDKIAFVSHRFNSHGSNVGDIFTMSLDGTQQTNLTDNSSAEGDPSFSPDGNKIAFTSNRFGSGNFDDFDILVMGADGSNQTNFTGSTATDDEPAYSPNGKKIAFVSTRDGGDEDVFTMDASNGVDQTDISQNQDFDFSPDWQPAGTTFTVNSTADVDDLNANDGVCDVDAASGEVCTLRAAIQQANFSATADNIKFNIPGTGVHTITPSTDLPTITHSTVLDGYTQPGSSANTLAKGTNAKPKIELSGTGTFGFGLRLGGTDPSSSVIRGLVINRFNNSGISVDGTANGSRIEGNFIGTDPTGTINRGNNIGVSLNVISGTVIGGNTRAARNLISGNEASGVDFEASSSSNKILGNLIGTTASGTGALGNGLYGIAVFAFGSSNNQFGDGSSAGANTIAFNGRDGIELGSFTNNTGNRISRNSIFSNGGLGIDLLAGSESDTTNVSTPNDPGDTDTGENGLQNFPVLSSAKSSSTTTTVAGSLNSTPGKTFIIQFFSNPSGNEGKTFIGQKSAATKSSGNVSFTFSPAAKVAVGQTITATATDPAGNTSEFSTPKTVGLASGSGLSPDTTRLSGPSGVTSNPTAHFKFTSPDPEATFECSLDGGAYYACSSPENINRLSEGRHLFEVRARDEEGNADPTPAAWIWAVEGTG